MAVTPEDLTSKTNNALSTALGTEPTPLPIPSTFGKEAKGYIETMQPLMKESAQAEGELKKFEYETQAKTAKNKAKTEREYIDKVQNLNKTAEEKEAEFPRPEFHPTQENALSLGSLFSLVSTMGMLVGASGKQSAGNAMSAMTGMLKGWQTGRKDLYEKEVKEFDKEYKRITDIRNEIQKKLEKSIALQTSDKEASFLELESARALADSNSVLGLTIKNRGAQEGLKLVKDTYKLQTDIDAIKAKKEEAQANRDLRLQQFEFRYGGGRGAATKLQEYFPNLSFAGTPSQNETKRESINSGALALVTAQELQEYAREHPNQLGRQGQIQQNVDRYLNSWKAGKSFEEMADDGQPALIFAKRYAAYLVAYERSLAGSNKAMTVAFQNRFNKLMSQDQFNAKGFDDLMNEQMSEVAKATASKDPAITGSGLLKYGDDIIGRAKLPTTETGQKLIPTITTQAEFDALPEGSVYIEDDKKYTKPRKQK